MFEFIFDHFMTFITIITPLAVGYLTYRSTRQEKQSKQYMELLKRNKELEKKEADREKKQTLDQIKELSESIETLKNEVKELKEEIDMKAITIQLSKLQHLNEINIEYVQSLSKVVTTLSEEALKSENVNEKRLQSVIDDHEDTETKIMKDIYKIMY